MIGICKIHNAPDGNPDVKKKEGLYESEKSNCSITYRDSDDESDGMRKQRNAAGRKKFGKPGKYRGGVKRLQKKKQTKSR